MCFVQAFRARIPINLEIRYTQVKYTFDAFLLKRIEITSEIHYDVINAQIPINLEIRYTQAKYTFDAFLLKRIEIMSEPHYDVINARI